MWAIDRAMKPATLRRRMAAPQRMESSQPRETEDVTVSRALVCPRLGGVRNRSPSQISRLKRAAGFTIIAPQRNNSAHLHLPWRAISVQDRLRRIPSNSGGGNTMADAVKDASSLYEVERRAQYGVRPGFRITELQISPSQKVPWHYHNNIEDTFYVVEGTLRIFLQEPKEEVRLTRGQTYAVPP